MITKTRSLALLIAMSAAAPAQSDDHYVHAVLLIRCGPTDIVLNTPLLDALLYEPGVTDNLKEHFGKRFSGIERITARMPAAHVAGTFQVHLGAHVRTTGDWVTEDHDKSIDALVAHLKQRLDAMLYDEPASELEQQRVQLRQQHANLQNDLYELRSHCERAETRSARAITDRDLLQQQLLAIELDVATEERAREHLAEMRDQNVAMRDKLEAERNDKRAVLNELTEALEQLRLRRAEAQVNGLDQAKLDELDQRIHDIEARVQQAHEALDQWQTLRNDIHNMLVLVLEQLPQCELKLQRARARLQSLRASLEEAEKLIVELTDKQTQLARTSTQIEHREIDLQVTRSHLIEVEGKIARLRPVRYELLRPR